VGGKGGGGGRGEKWPKPYMHIWIIKQLKNNNNKKEEQYVCIEETARVKHLQAKKRNLTKKQPAGTLIFDF
jgi:hypothetical protein